MLHRRSDPHGCIARKLRHSKFSHLALCTNTKGQIDKLAMHTADNRRLAGD